MAIFWAKEFVVEDRKVKLEIMIGEIIIGDKMYYRVDGSHPVWFDMNETPVDYINRDSIIHKGLDLIHERFGDIKLYDEEGKEFSWHDV